MNRRNFLTHVGKFAVVLGAAAFVPISVPEILLEEPLLDIHVDKELTDISASYCTESSPFMADKLFPNLPSPEMLIRERLLEIQEEEFVKLYYRPITGIPVIKLDRDHSFMWSSTTV